MEQTALLSAPGSTIVIVPPGIPRIDVGRRLAAQLISGDEEQAKLVLRGVHPDLIELAPRKGKERIGIEQVREVIRSGQFAPVEGLRKVCLIPQGEALTPEAENSLLKVLEEPRRELSFVILVGEAQDLLPTIRSRSRLVRLPAPGASELLSRLLELGYPEDVAQFLLGLLSGEEIAPFLNERVAVEEARARVQGKLAKAELAGLCSLALSDDPLEAYEAVIALLGTIACRGPVEAVRAARGVSAAGRSGVLRFFERAERTLFTAVRRGNSLLPPHPGLDALLRTLGEASLIELSQRAEEARRTVEGYGPAEGVLLSFFLRFGGMR